MAVVDALRHRQKVLGLGRAAPAALGLIGGFTLLHFRDDIVGFIARLTMGPDAFAKFYQFSSLPAHTVPADVAIIIVFSVLASTVDGEILFGALDGVLYVVRKQERSGA